MHKIFKHYNIQPTFTIMKKNTLSIIVFALAILTTIGAKAENFRLTEGLWAITHNDSEQGLTIDYNGKRLFNKIYASIQYNKKGSSSTSTLSTRTTSLKPTITSYDVNDTQGTGKCYQFAYYKNGVTLKHMFTFYNDKPYMIVSATLVGDEGIEVETRQIIAMATTTESTPFKGENNRMLWVPFDNDGHIKYKNITLTDNSENISHEVTAIFDGKSRYGLVVGSIDHDTWKSGIKIKGKEGYKLTNLQCISGYTSNNTRDSRSHGKISGKEVSSARYFVGMFDDWREGLDTYAATNALVAPPAEWTKGNPMGWNSWGVMQTVVNYDGVVETARFIKDSLYQYGFYNKEGKTVISLDSYAKDNITPDNILKLGKKILSNGTYTESGKKLPGTNQTLGHYYGPFIIWEWTLDDKVEGTGKNGIPEYYWSDAALKVNDKIYKVSSNGGYATDPTHPAVKANIEYTLKLWNSWGVKYIKADFLNNGIIEGDSWYNPEIKTGVQAYNYGMKILLETAQLYNMYIVESISPIFPYQYAHGRRISCDRFSEISESEYVMNALSYGWWTDKLYTVNDPDHLVMCKQNNGAKETMGENRARATTGMVTGAYIFGDNFSLKGLKGGAKPGYAAESRKRAIEIMGNADINDYVRNNTGSFKPLEGDDPSKSQQAESFFVRDTEKYFYLAIFNYSTSTEKTGKVSFERMGIDPEKIESIKELWMNKNVTYDNYELSYNIPAKDARVYRITKSTSTSIADIESEETSISITSYDDENVSICANKEIAFVAIYNTDGTLLSKNSCNNEKEISLALPTGNNLYIIKTTFADGSNNVIKYKIA